MRVLVLCHGNVNRSPFVAALIAHHRPEWEVMSAGLKTTHGRRPTRKAREAAAKRGLVLEGYSDPINFKMTDRAEIILYMDGGNEKRLRAFIEEHYPPSRQAHAWGKCKLLATYGSLRRVPDPNYTSDLEELRRMFGEAELCTMKFLEAHPA